MEKTLQNQTSLSRYDNSWYEPGGVVKRLIWYLVSIIFIDTYLPVPMFLKRLLLKTFGAKIGQNVVLKPKVNIKYPWFLSVGDDTWIGEKVWIDNLTMVNIGSNVCLSQGCMLLTGNHDFTSARFDLIVKPITLGNGVWIGAKATVCPGVTAESHSVLTVNSVATKNMEAYGIYQGNPAELIKKRQIKH
ncbi:MAG TPA: WcaF family extracellular polysaccharide biosynthesis acetyltransferase [Dyadobacter sp.]|jgi:putative colanic acid biosynthesis acetyltransferase WcaF|nr:WcaF family extracellular polysaccharide biosynthesis acetyltransferase [Dyadobacter sp.]